MEELKICTVKSPINHDMERLNQQFFEELEQALAMKICLEGPSSIGSEDFCIVYIASGGSEIQFLELMGKLQAKRIYLLTSGYSNSLAASMEILSYIRSQGLEGSILHGAPKEVSEKLARILRVERAAKRMKGMRVGQVGEPSDWLIASKADRESVQKTLGIELVEIPMEELIREFEMHTYVHNRWTDLLATFKFDKKELEKALEIYGAMKRLTEQYGLGGLSVRCFDLLGSIGATGCLGLAILNAEGIYGGCEGDMPSLISMIILGELSGQPVFQCNPSRIDLQKGEMVFAHCTLPLNMPYEMELMTHFESRIGVSVSGAIPERECTIFKASNDLGRYFVQTGQIMENMHDDTLCRTQIRVKLPGCQYFLEEPISNHHLICIGSWAEEVDAFFRICS